LGAGEDARAFFGWCTSMPNDRSEHIRDLSAVLKWLRRREALSLVARNKYQSIHVDNPTSLSLAMMSQHDKRWRVLGWLVSCVELDLKTLATHGQAEGTRGANRK
jgi:hypothetical protein